MSDKHNSSDANIAPKSVIPLGVTISLFVASLVLSLAGYGFRLMAGDDVNDVLSHAIKVVPFFLFVMPALIWLGSVVLNKIGKAAIHPRNAWTLGWLLSTVSMLSIMGVYS
ncbi:hypothetical protein AAX05_04750 [Moraxella bovoculi]|uniref:Uncharacterized protein n=1 Tax=Moraxella bovoculi TaxID=386891 RepID=A0AAC8PY27_9GAMM|nr:hypothetical protein [Moraxella bovoculi]AKG07874.1 hypothetical protein AAX06_06555 [Moraxella bovoculi]AKG09589.1 hypothetical protein AAX05_04750 [Moraxella bovoculi]AKG11405.1 hypothetical protein AAX07_04725 [Moraxella bovoculi]AKG13413.1 hypothetical protein AAX11_04495 [Moraxella bovoculi]